MYLTTHLLNNLLEAAEKCKASQDFSYQFKLALKLQDIQNKLKGKKLIHQKLTENPLYYLETVEDVIRYNLNIIMFITCTRQFLDQKAETTSRFLEIEMLKATKEKKRPMMLTNELVNDLLKAAAECKTIHDIDYQFRLALKLQDIYAKLNPTKRNHQKLTENPLYNLEKVEDVISYNLSIIMLTTGIPQISGLKSQESNTVEKNNLTEENKSVQGKYRKASGARQVLALKTVTSFPNYTKVINPKTRQIDVNRKNEPKGDIKPVKSQVKLSSKPSSDSTKNKRVKGSKHTDLKQNKKSSDKRNAKKLKQKINFAKIYEIMEQKEIPKPTKPVNFSLIYEELDRCNVIKPKCNLY